MTHVTSSTSPNIGVIGAGNIGTAMAALLSRAGANVWLTARGKRLAYVQDHGIALDDRGTVVAAHPTAVEYIDTAMDALFVCVKSQDLGTAIHANAAALTPDTLVIPMVNGLPFWFFANGDDMGHVPLLDPNGHLDRYLRPGQVLGAALLMTVRMDADAQAISSNTPTLSLGPVVQDVDQERLDALVATLEAGGVRTDISPDIRTKTMVKLLANFATNPLSSLTGALLDEIGKDPDLCQIAVTLAQEFRTWAAPLGYDLPPDSWLTDILLDAGPFPTSMLQDTLAGKPLELDAIAKAPLALARQNAGDMPLMNRLLFLLETTPHLPVPKAELHRHLDDLLTFDKERVSP